MIRCDAVAIPENETEQVGELLPLERKCVYEVDCYSTTINHILLYACGKEWVSWLKLWTEEDIEKDFDIKEWLIHQNPNIYYIRDYELKPIPWTIGIGDWDRRFEVLDSLRESGAVLYFDLGDRYRHRKKEYLEPTIVRKLSKPTIHHLL